MSARPQVTSFAISVMAFKPGTGSQFHPENNVGMSSPRPRFRFFSLEGLVIELLVVFEAEFFGDDDSS